MAKRKLTHRQSTRIKQKQEVRRQRAAKNTSAKPSQAEDPTLGPETHGTVVANLGATLLVENSQAQVFRCTARQNLPALVCGDVVVWQETTHEQGVVVALEPRSNTIARSDKQGHNKTIAANISRIIVVCAPKPTLNEGLIDRYLIAAENAHIQSAIVLNKIDFLDKSEKQTIEDRLSIYTDIGYDVLYTSAKDGHGIEQLSTYLCDKTSIFVGHSGVGKSSLINCIIPDMDVRVGQISNTTGEGRHTTTTTRLYHLPDHLPGNGSIIDSPGIREFGLCQLDAQQVEVGFREFQDYLGQCRFRNCRHQDEPGCAIQQAVQDGGIAPRRLESYQRIITTLKG